MSKHRARLQVTHSLTQAKAAGRPSTKHGARPTAEPLPLPEKPAEMAWRDYLVMLLHIASELEHSLMVQYLYAAYSLPDGPDAHADGDQGRQCNQWREAILTIAKEEMGHLLTVQNILSLVGGEVCFDRTDFPWDSPFLPFPFQLEKLSLDSLAHYVFAEMPLSHEMLALFYSSPKKAGETMRRLLEDHSNALGKHGKEFSKEEQKRIVAHVKRRMQAWKRERSTRPVSQVYEAIIDLIGDRRRIRDSDFRADTFPLQASWDDWGRGYKPPPAPPHPGGQPAGARDRNVLILQAATRTEAVAALQAIASQGEAPSPEAADGEQSHFLRFCRIYLEFDAYRTKTRGRGVPVRNVAANPTTIPASDFCPAGLAPITNPCARDWANLFNVRYRLLLTYLTHTFRLARLVPADEPNTRGAVMHKVFGEMYNLKAIAGILVRLPLKPEARPGSVRAGPPFEMPYSLTLPLDELDCWRLYHDILENAMHLSRDLLRSVDQLPAEVASTGREYLQALLDLDGQSTQWVQSVIRGLQGRRRAEA